jgi:hypothetical protein
LPFARIRSIVGLSPAAGTSIATGEALGSGVLSWANPVERGSVNVATSRRRRRL